MDIEEMSKMSDMLLGSDELDQLRYTAPTLYLARKLPCRCGGGDEHTIIHVATALRLLAVTAAIVACDNEPISTRKMLKAIMDVTVYDLEERLEALAEKEKVN